MNDKVLDIAKMVVSGLVSTGAGAVVGNAIKQSTPEDLKTYKKVSLIIGGWALSGVAASHASAHVSGQIDSTISQVIDLKNRFAPKKP